MKGPPETRKTDNRIPNARTRKEVPVDHAGVSPGLAGSSAFSPSGIFCPRARAIWQNPHDRHPPPPRTRPTPRPTPRTRPGTRAPRRGRPSAPKSPRPRNFLAENSPRNFREISATFFPPSLCLPFSFTYTLDVAHVWDYIHDRGTGSGAHVFGGAGCSLRGLHSQPPQTRAPLLSGTCLSQMGPALADSREIGFGARKFAGCLQTRQRPSPKRRPGFGASVRNPEWRRTCACKTAGSGTPYAALNFPRAPSFGHQYVGDMAELGGCRGALANENWPTGATDSRSAARLRAALRRRGGRLRAPRYSRNPDHPWTVVGPSVARPENRRPAASQAAGHHNLALPKRQGFTHWKAYQVSHSKATGFPKPGPRTGFLESGSAHQPRRMPQEFKTRSWSIGTTLENAATAPPGPFLAISSPPTPSKLEIQLSLATFSQFDPPPLPFSICGKC